MPGFSVPVHRALTEHILLGGAPHSLAILNGTLAAALGLGLRLWLVGLGLWAVGHFAAVWAAKRDPEFVDVVEPAGNGDKLGRNGAVEVGATEARGAL
ncbi:VirB3 family type IV secretion system protein [Mesorhizobium australicum]|uniref:VirB3 family type IV secretion system protein n=1 Tax=Mesorhizobium australicum TaxID=536018 RepID=A0ACC6T7Z7_9HYPH